MCICFFDWAEERGRGFVGKTKSLSLFMSYFLCLFFWVFRSQSLNVSAGVLNEYILHPNSTELDPAGRDVLLHSIVFHRSDSSLRIKSLHSSRPIAR